MDFWNILLGYGDPKHPMPVLGPRISVPGFHCTSVRTQGLHIQILGEDKLLVKLP